MKTDELIDKLASIRTLIVAARAIVKNFPKGEIDSLYVRQKGGWPIQCGSSAAEALRKAMLDLDK